MNDIIMFLNVHYKNALKLVSDFDITKSKKWDSQIYLNELYVQLGHVYNVLFSNDKVNENKRVIDNLGDELSDVLLQLINLAKILNINMYDIKELKDYKYEDINGLSILLGQLTEAIMEMNECRFKKDRIGYITSYDFVKDRLFKLFIITYNISKQYNLDMIEEFSAMCKDANGFLRRFRTGKRKTKEYIDIYDSKEQLLGYCEKNQAHKLGYWHKVFGCMIYNSKTNKVFFQFKNPKHNNIHDKPLLEITAGGHLISGETLVNGVREIKEETGLDVEYNELVFLKKRKCNKKIKKDYIIKEFQYYYSVDLDIKVSDFNNFDKKEVLSFVEFNINDVIKLLNNNIKNIKGRNNKGEVLRININHFDKAFVENKLYLILLRNLKSKQVENKMNNKIRKLYKTTRKQLKKNPDKFLFDDGKVCRNKDFKKENIKYSVMCVNKNIKSSEYLIYLLAIINHKSIPQLLVKEFSNKKETKEYFDYLCELVENNTNIDIIDKCYEEKFKKEKNNIFKKVLNFSTKIFN